MIERDNSRDLVTIVNLALSKGWKLEGLLQIIPITTSKEFKLNESNTLSGVKYTNLMFFQVVTKDNSDKID